jgi:SAM-dependent methyltransferase
MTTTAAYFDGLNQKLLSAIPPDARSALEFGCASGRLGAACKMLRPGLRWTGVDAHPSALAEAAARLDHVVSMDLDAPDAAFLGRGYDVVVMGDVLEHLRDPGECLRIAHSVSGPQARLVACIPNMAHVSVIERMLAGDLTYDATGLLDSTHLRFLSPASAFKLLLDAGWLPDLLDRYVVGHPDEAFLGHLVAAAGRLGIPRQTACSHLLSYQLIIDCIKAPTCTTRADARFSVVVPVTNRQQFELNVNRSPGLAEANAEIIVVEGARSAADAFAAGRARASTGWIVFCHQDVYFPKGSGHALAACFAAIPSDLRQQTLIGFAGLGATDRGAQPAGLVTDRSARFDHPASTCAVSIDELAVAMSVDTIHAIDPALGWHLWATDLCLAAGRSEEGNLRIERIPLFHNSYNDGQLSASFHAAARMLRRKYPHAGAIPTLCGIL